MRHCTADPIHHGGSQVERNGLTVVPSLAKLVLLDSQLQVEGECRLCGSVAELKLSHVIPAFVFRWLRKSSATGHMRSGEEPNRRVQDGSKERWLCASCEQDIGEAESQFARNVFSPVAEDRPLPDAYGPWLLKFCTSATWRVLLQFREKDPFDDYSRDDISLMDQAASTWREYLLGRRPDTGAFAQHLYIVRGVVASTGQDVASNINRHVLRHIATDVVRGQHQHIVYAKLPRLFIMGVLRDDRPSDWRGTRIDAGEGTISGHQRVPSGLVTYVNEAARRASNRMGSMSDHQKRKVLEDVRRDPTRAKRSDTVRAFRLDDELGS